MRLATILLAAAALSGCAAVMPAATVTGAGASLWTAAQTAKQDIDEALLLDRPIKQIICEEHPVKSPAFAAWCANLPVNMAGLVKQWAAVALAKAIENGTGQ